MLVARWYGFVLNIVVFVIVFKTTKSNFTPQSKHYAIENPTLLKGLAVAHEKFGLYVLTFFFSNCSDWIKSLNK